MVYNKSAAVPQVPPTQSSPPLSLHTTRDIQSYQPENFFFLLLYIDLLCKAVQLCRVIFTRKHQSSPRSPYAQTFIRKGNSVDTRLWQQHSQGEYSLSVKQDQVEAEGIRSKTPANSQLGHQPNNEDSLALTLALALYNRLTDMTRIKGNHVQAGYKNYMTHSWFTVMKQHLFQIAFLQLLIYSDITISPGNEVITQTCVWSKIDIVSYSISTL